MNTIKAGLNKQYKKKADGKFTVYVWTVVNRERVQFPVGISVLEKDWDEVKQQVKDGAENAKDWNLIINNTKARITQIYVRYKLSFETLTPEKLRYEYMLSESSEDFHSYAKFKFEETKEKLSTGTQRRHLSQLTKIKEFSPSLILKDINPIFVEKYVVWMRKVKKNKQSSIRSSTNVLKVYVNCAVKDKLIKNNPFDEVKVSEGNNYREYLTEDELKRVEALYSSAELSERKRRVLRAFLFGCFTGLRLSDIKQLTNSHIHRNEITITMHKTKNTTGRIIRIPLNTPANNLLKESVMMDSRKPIFECEMNINIALQEALKDIGIDKKITFHCSRHTFATIFLRRTNNILGLKQLLGHSKIEQTLIYSHLIQSDLENDMKCFDKI